MRAAAVRAQRAQQRKVHGIGEHLEAAQPPIDGQLIVGGHVQVAQYRHHNEQAGGKHAPVEGDQLHTIATPAPASVCLGAQSVGGLNGEEDEQRHLQAELLEARRQLATGVGVVGGIG